MRELRGSSVNELLLTVASAADILSISPKSIIRMCGRGEITYVLVGKLYRFRRAWVEEWVDRNAQVTNEVSNCSQGTLDTTDMTRFSVQLRGGWTKTRSQKKAS